MRKCPKCGAYIQENARFCLYCMTSFDEKKEIYIVKRKRKTNILIFALFLSAIFFLGVLFSILGNSLDENSSIQHESASKIENSKQDFYDNSLLSSEFVEGSQEIYSEENFSSEMGFISEYNSIETGDLSEYSSIESESISEEPSAESNNKSETETSKNETASENSSSYISENNEIEYISFEDPTPEEEPDSYGTSIGDIVFFGNYEQDNNLSNGTERIKWKILDIQGDRALIISKYGIDAKKPSFSNKTWEEWYLRDWLNTDFYNDLFNETEKTHIESVYLTEDHVQFDANVESYKLDKVFLLSLYEAKKYFSSNEERQCFATPYAILSSGTKVESICTSPWLLRSSHSNGSVMIVSSSGIVGDGISDSVSSDDNALRPAMWVNLQYLKDTSFTPDEENNTTKEEEISFSDLSVGEVITLGKYEQDGIIINGKENVEWTVLDVKDGKALIVSKYLLDLIPYNQTRRDVMWESCTLRKWLNNKFYTFAFNSEEREIICNTTLLNNDNPYYGTDGGNPTTDKIFILSVDEVLEYCVSTDIEKSWNDCCKNTNGEVICTQTELVNLRNIFTSVSSWVLRTPGQTQFNASCVTNEGQIRVDGRGVSLDYCGIRPAMWIKIEK